jgi:hypothetical protein
VTVFSVQRFLEDHFERRGLADLDQYAIRIANAFDRAGPIIGEEKLAQEFGRVRTVFFRRNVGVDRKSFERRLAATLRRRFPKKAHSTNLRDFVSGLARARARIRGRRLTVAALLAEFKRAVEARAIDSFWVSRRRHRPELRPEKIGQALLAVFARGVLGNSGFVLREIHSGVGFVDIGLSFNGILHLVELKMLRGELVGAEQLATYMRTEQRAVGWLVLFDARTGRRKGPLPTVIGTSAGRIRIVSIEVNPEAPHIAG